MKKIIASLVIAVTLLSGCWLKKDSPEEIIKQTQNNIIQKMQKNVLAKKQVQYESNISLDAKSPFWAVNWNVLFTWISTNLTWLVNIDGNINFDIQSAKKQSWSAKIDTTLIVTLKKVYFKLSNFELSWLDPSIMMYSNMVKMILNKWFYYENNQQVINSTIKNADFWKILKKYPLFKVKKEIKNRDYLVKLNKKNLEKVIIEINEQVNKNFTWNYDDLKRSLSWFDLEWELNIKSDNLHFTFSWDLRSDTENVSFQLVYLKNKIRLLSPVIEVNFDINNDKYDWYLLINKENIKIPVKWTIWENIFSADVTYKQNWVDITVNLDYKIKKTNQINIKIPDNATDVKDLMKSFWN